MVSGGGGMKMHFLARRAQRKFLHLEISGMYGQAESRFIRRSAAWLLRIFFHPARRRKRNMLKALSLATEKLFSVLITGFGKSRVAFATLN